jgi:hypothetical protein
MTIINKNRQIQPGQADAVPPLKDFDVFAAEIEKLQKLCSYIRQEEEKAASDKKKKCEKCGWETSREEAEKQNANEKAQVLKNYVIIRSVGVADNLFQSMAADLIDTFKISARSFGKQGSWDSDVMQIHLDDLDKIKSEDMTLGKIITSEGRLANTRGIGDIFQKINNIHESDKARKKREKDSRITTHPFFDWLQDLMQIKKEEENMVMQVDEMIKMRNDIAHNIHNVRDSADELLHKIEDLKNLAVMMWFASFIHLSRGKIDNRKNAITCEQCFSMTLDEFYAITDKHKKT